MFYTELVKQAADMAGLSNVYSSGMDPTEAQKAFDALRTSLLAMNSDGRIAFAVEDIELNLTKNILVLTPDADYIPASGEQVYLTAFPVEVPPSYVIGSQIIRFSRVNYEDFITRHIGSPYVCAMRVDYGKATLFFNGGGRLKIGLKKPLDMPLQITDEAKLTGSALNLLKYKLATELQAAYGMGTTPEIEQKYAEMIGRHNQIKASIPAAPTLRPRL